MDLEIRDLGDDDREEAYALRSQAFGARREPFDPESPARDPDRDVVRGAYLDGRLVATATAVAWGQWFGGEEVPMGGLAGVATAPDVRGSGAGPRLVRDVLALMRERGLAVSTLYPSTTAYYRRLGWEVAGPWHRLRIPSRSLASLPRPDGHVGLTPTTYADVDFLRRVYDRVAPGRPGWLGRDDGLWARRRWEFEKDDGPQRHLYLATRGDDPVGYVAYHHTEDDPRFYGLGIDDLVAVDGETLVALLRLVGSNRTVTQNVTWSGADLRALLLLLPEQDVEVSSLWHWMTRLVDAPAAIAARGYPAGARARIALRLHDDDAPWNAGDWVLEVEGGSGRLASGGDGTVAMDAGALATLYSGATSARVLSQLGRIDGAREDDLATLDAVFGGPAPWLPDFF